ncbi:hypothetical protein, partial [Neobacillus mesonae]|uniref:hypothetical protein n=1 Tax=Neobacillus mesonae TaxID=1193713 RepID=UPI0037C5CC14|nr:hypothetical protein [Neobacillus mesonae]
IKEEVVDSSVLALIVQFLKSGILENGVVYENDNGSPQGGVISVNSHFISSKISLIFSNSFGIVYILLWNNMLNFLHIKRGSFF